MAESGRAVRGTQIEPSVALLRRGRGALLRGTALQGALVLFVVLPGAARPSSAAAQPAPGARPQGGQVVAGAAGIQQNAAVTRVDQASQRAAIDWRSFDVGRDHAVVFVQPNPSAVVLNRVTGPDPSAIAGRIQANGQVIITNPSGVLFHQGAQVDAQGLVVSAAGITNRNFMAGRMVFDQRPHPDAKIENRGTITVKETGLAALVAPQVSNSGTIIAKLGRAVLGGAETHTLDLYGDGLLLLDVTNQVRQVPRGPDGKPAQALVTNTGNVVAEGGTVQLTAAAADGLVQTLVRAGGRVAAPTAAGRRGRIELSGNGGSVVVEGLVQADGHGPSDSGGDVAVMASGAVAVRGGAQVSASGRGGGGTVALGTTLARAAEGRAAALAPPGAASLGTPVGTTRRVAVAPGAQVSADGRGTGRGGTVAVLSTQETRVSGQLSAQSGERGGTGGVVEVSSAGHLQLDTAPDVSAPRGRGGTVFLDPEDLIIGTGGPAATFADNFDPTGDIGFDGAPATGTSFVLPSTLAAARSGVVVRLQAQRDITVAQDVILGSGSPGNGTFLVLQAGRNVTVNPGVRVQVPASLTLVAGDTAAFQPDPAGSLRIGANSVLSASGSVFLSSGLRGSIEFAQGSAITTGSGGVGILARSGTGGTSIAGTLTTGTSSTPGGSVRIELSSSGSVTEAVTGALNTPNLVGTATSYGLTSQNNQVRSVGGSTPRGQTVTAAVVDQPPSAVDLPLSATAGDVVLVNRDSLVVGGQGSPAGGISVPPGRLVALTTDRLDVGAIPANPSPGTLPVPATIYAPSGTIVVQPFTGGQPVELRDAGAKSGFSITQDELGRMQAATLRLGSERAGPLVIAPGGGTVTATAPPANPGNGFAVLDLRSGGAVTEPGGLVVNSLSVRGASVALDSSATPATPQNRIGVLAGAASDGALTIRNGVGLPVSGPVAGGGAVVLSAIGDLTLDAPASGTSVELVGAQITQAAGAAITAGRLTGNATARVTLDQPNQVGTLGTFTTGAGFAFNGARPLSVDGSVSAALGTVGLAIASGPLSLGPASSLRADRVSLSASGSITQAEGGVIAGPFAQAGATLTASGSSVALTSSANRVQALGISSATAGDFALTTSLASSYGVTAGPPVALASIPLTLAGAVTAPTGRSIILTADQMAASPTGPTAPRLSAPGGTVALAPLTPGRPVELIAGGTADPAALSVGPGLLAAVGTGTLQLGSLAAGPIKLGNTGDAINLAGSAATLRLLSGGAVTQGGILAVNTLTGQAGSAALNGTNAVGALGAFTTVTGFSLVNAAALRVVGPVADPASVGLRTTAGDLTLAGPVSTPGTLSLSAAGSVAQAGGVVTAGTLTGVAGSLLLEGAGNQVTSLGPYAATIRLALADARGLAITGAVSAPDVALSSAGGLTIGAPLTGGTVALNAAGAVTQGAGGNLSAAVLTGNAESVALGSTGASNAVAGLGDFASTSGFDLRQNAPLVVGGTVRDGTRVSLDAGGRLELRGTVAAPEVELRSRSTAPTGTLQAGVLQGGPGDIVQSAGLVSAPGRATFTADGSIQQTGGRVETALLQGSAGGGVGFGSAANGVAALGVFSSNGGFALADGRSLTVTGPVVDARSIGLGSSGDLTLAGPLSAPAVDLRATGIVTQPDGTVTTNALTGRAGAGVTLGQARNQIEALGAFGSNAGDVQVSSGAGLDVTGPVQAGLGRTLSLAADRVNLLPGSSLSAPGGTVALTPLTPGSGFALSNGSLSQFQVNAQMLRVGSPQAGPVRISGTNNLAGANVLDLQSGASIAQDPDSALQATTLTGQAPIIVLEGANRIGEVRDLRATAGALSLVNRQALLVTGTVAASELALTVAGDVTLGNAATAGSLATPGTATVRATGALGGPNGGITANVLQGTAGEAVLTGENRIGTLGGFSTSGALALTNGQALRIGGPVSAGSLTVQAPGGITLDGGSLVLGAMADNVLRVLPGAESTGRIAQTGTSTVAGPGGATVRLQLELPRAGGTITLENMRAERADLTLALGAGSVTGNVAAGSLLAVGSGGSSTLFGQVSGQEGGGAARAARILPRIDLGYRLNGCVIEAATCVPFDPLSFESFLSPQGVLEPVYLARRRDDTDALILPPLATLMPEPEGQEVPLPNISDRDN